MAIIRANNGINDLVIWANNETEKLVVEENNEKVQRQAVLATSDPEEAKLCHKMATVQKNLGPKLEVLWILGNKQFLLHAELIDQLTWGIWASLKLA
jgi:hypothetical protein